MVIESPIWIIVLNWRGWADTIACLDSIKSIEQPATKILVVDNGSGDESIERLRAYKESTGGPRFTLLETGENLGFAGGMNYGMAHAIKEGAAWILLLNNDTKISPDFLKILFDAAKTDERIGMLNPKILSMENVNKIWSVGGKINKIMTKGSHIGQDEIDTGQYDKPKIQDSAYTTAGCVLLRREMLDRIGFLSSAYFLYYEDTEWSIRAQRAGFRTVVVPQAKIWHKGAASTSEMSSAYIRYHVRNGLIFARRVGNPAQIIAAYAWSAVRALWQIVKFFIKPKERVWAVSTLRGIIDAWMGKRGRIPKTYA